MALFCVSSILTYNQSKWNKKIPEELDSEIALKSFAYKNPGFPAWSDWDITLPSCPFTPSHGAVIGKQGKQQIVAIIIHGSRAKRIGYIEPQKLKEGNHYINPLIYIRYHVLGDEYS